MNRFKINLHSTNISCSRKKVWKDEYHSAASQTMILPKSTRCLSPVGEKQIIITSKSDHNLHEDEKTFSIVNARSCLRDIFHEWRPLPRGLWIVRPANLFPSDLALDKKKADSHPFWLSNYRHRNVYLVVVSSGDFSMI